MNDNRNLTIVLLCVSATLLLAVLLAVSHTQRQAAAASAESRGGDYIMVPGQVGQSLDVVYVIDASAQRMNGYSVTRNGNAIERVPGAIVDLRAAFAGGADPAGGRVR